MIRKYILATDNTPKFLDFNFVYGTDTTTVDGVEQYVLQTGPISWAVITQSNVISSFQGVYSGPIDTNGDGTSGPYLLTDFGAPADHTFDTGSLIVFLNGQLLNNGTDYTELTDHSFEFENVNDGWYPDVDDEIMIVYAESTSSLSVGSATVGIVGNITSGDTSITLDLEGFSSGDTIQIGVLCL